MGRWGSVVLSFIGAFVDLAPVRAFAFVFFFSSLAVYSEGEWREESAATGTPVPVEDLKRDFLADPGLNQLHHAVYERVGERYWEEFVKPRFLQRVTSRVLQEEGNLFPDGGDVSHWVRRNPEQARRDLLEASQASEIWIGAATLPPTDQPTP